MSSSNCCFLTCIQVSEEAGQVVCYFHLFQNFPQFIMIHTVKGFGIVNKAEIDVFLELSCFFHDPVDGGNLISGSSAFSKTSLNIWKFMIHNFTAILWVRQSWGSCHRAGKASETHLMPSLGARQSPGSDSDCSGSKALHRCYHCMTSPRRRWFLISFFQPLWFFLEHWGNSNSSKTQCLD